MNLMTAGTMPLLNYIGNFFFLPMHPTPCGEDPLIHASWGGHPHLRKHQLIMERVCGSLQGLGSPGQPFKIIPNKHIPNQINPAKFDWIDPGISNCLITSQAQGSIQ